MFFNLVLHELDDNSEVETFVEHSGENLEIQVWEGPSSIVIRQKVFWGLDRFVEWRQRSGVI